jgi:hypothetical protein
MGLDGVEACRRPREKVCVIQMHSICSQLKICPTTRIKPFDNMTNNNDNKNAKTAAALSNEPSYDDPPFEIGELHEMALKELLRCHHNYRQTLTYPELSQSVGKGEKTKSWQCVAWKDLKSNDYIVESSSADTKGFELSEQGVRLASSLATEEELALYKVPETNEELHEKIKGKLAAVKKAALYGPRILDHMLAPDYTPITRHQLAAKFNVLADSHGFFYGLKALTGMGYVEFCASQEIAELKASVVATPDQETDVTLSEREIKETLGAKEKTRAREESDESNEPQKKKVKIYKSTKQRAGGKPLKLSDKAFVHPHQATDVVTDSDN